MSKQGTGRTSTIVRASMGALVSQQALPFVLPWLICLGAMPVALLAHWRWGDDPGMTAWMGVIAAFITVCTYVTWGNRHVHTRNVAVMVTGFASVWTVMAAASKPWSNSMVNMWIMGSIAVCVMWDIRYAGLSGREQDKHEGQQDGLLDMIRSLKGGRTKKVSLDKDNGTVDARVQLQSGESTAQAVQADKDLIASAASLGADSVIVMPVQGRADQVDIKFTVGTGTDINKAVVWPGLSAPGKSVADAPLRFGQRMDGKDMAIWVCGQRGVPAKGIEPRPLAHGLCTGMSGAGKTETVKTLVVEGRSRIDFVPIIGDPAKFDQSFGDIADLLEIAAKGKQQVNQLIRNIPETIEYRAELLGGLTRSNGMKGYPEWEPECWTNHGIPLVFIDIEEATDVLESSAEEMDEAIRKARSVGIFLFISLQTATYSNIDRKTRGQFGQSLCHGVKEIQDAKFTLSPKTLDAGADPVKWQNDKPGSLYAELVGVPKEEWALDGRAFCIPDEEKRALADATRPHWARLDAGTAMRIGRGITMPDAKITAPLPAVADDEPEEEVQENIEVTDLTQVLTQEGEAVDITSEIPAPTGDPIPLAPPQVNGKMTTEEARHMLESAINELEESGSREVNYRDLAEIPALTSRSRQWVYAELKRLVDEGRLLEGPEGKPPYTIQPRVPEAV